MTELIREHHHHPTACLPAYDPDKVAASRRLLSETPFKSLFYYVPSAGTHEWICDFIDDLEVFSEVAAYVRKRGEDAMKEAVALRQLSNAVTVAQGNVNPTNLVSFPDKGGAS